MRSEVAAGHETKATDADGRVRRKDKKKKLKKVSVRCVYITNGACIYTCYMYT